MVQRSAQDTPVALVTGAAHGIGRVIARELHGRGHRVLAADRLGPAADRAAADLDATGTTAAAVQADITDTAAVEAMVAEALGRFGRLDALVNNAGFAGRHDAAEISDADWAAMLDVNLAGALRCSRAARPALAAAPAPAIVNVSSISARLGMAGRAAYAAAKAGLEALTRTLAVEWAPQGIRVNAVAPGYVRTEAFDSRMADQAPALEALVPLGRLGRPEDVAAAVAFLLSEDAGYVTGQVIVIDGGVSIRASG